MNNKPVTILLIEDNADDVLILERGLSKEAKGKYILQSVDSLAKGLDFLSSSGADIVLLDLGLPDTYGLSSFERLRGYAPAVPIIVLTGNDDDNIAILSVQKGAQDYLVKGKTDGVLLWRAIRYAIERQKLLMQIEHSTKEIKTLQGFLPICASCKKIRDDQGYWTKIETYISEHSGAEFSHGLCPDCAGNLYGEFLDKKKK